MNNLNESLIDLNSVKYDNSGEFSLSIRDEGNFISNGKIRINCSEIVRSAFDQEIFFTVKFIPDGIPLTIPYRLFNIFFYEEIAKAIADIDYARNFILKFSNSFDHNEWFSLEWLKRLVAKMDISITDKIVLINDISGFNSIQLIYLYRKGVVDYSVEKLLNSIPYKVSPTSAAIISIEDIWTILRKDVLDFNKMIKYFDITDNILNELNGFEIKDVTGISYFEIDLSDVQLRENLYKNINRISQLDEGVFSSFAVRFRTIENELRCKLGYNSVGSLFTESLLFNKIKNLLSNYQVISQYSPSWLSPQRFDIFIKEKNIAIEYNGIQHYEPIDFFGGLEGFNRTKQRDIEKRKKCKKNNCLLIEIKYDEDLDEAIERILSIVIA